MSRMTIARNDNSLLERPRLLLQDSTALAKEDSLMIDLTSEICYELTRPPLPLSSTHVFTEVKDLVWFDSGKERLGENVHLGYLINGIIHRIWTGRYCGSRGG